MACKSNHDFSQFFCINEGCPSFGRQGEGNIRLKGHTGKDKSIHELYCHQCSKAFSERNGTPFYKGRLDEGLVLSIVHHLLEGNGVRGTARLLGVHRDTVVRYLGLVGTHVLAVMNMLLVNLHCQEIQLDEFWAFVNKKEKNASTREKLEKGYGDRWIHLAMDAGSRLIVACAVGRRTQKTTDAVVAEVTRRLANPADALYTSDEHEPYLVAMARLAKSLEPAVTEAPGRPEALPAVEEVDGGAPEDADFGADAAEPAIGATGADPSLTAEAEVRPGFVFATVRKERKGNRVVKVRRTLQIGTQDDLETRLDASPVSNKVNTSFIERLNNSERQMGRRVSRKTMGFSKEADLLDSQIHIQTAYYNLVRPHGGLAVVIEEDDVRVRKQRTPAMAAGIEDHPWTLNELLTARIPPQNQASEAA